MNVLKNLMKPLVLCGPSGVGKGTLIGMLLDEYPKSFGFSVSHTTRPPRDGEKHGKEYYFVKRDEFEQGIKKNEFLEVFIYPPDTEELERRLRGRESDSEEQILTRMKNAKIEMEFSKTHRDMIDKTIVNDDLETAFGEFKSTIQGVYFE